ncbi:nitroreductase family protein [Vagococcus sp. BWB3-3]|uniref:Nitroreductase family protein n=1 Tax=Vagococcus allomyrinae TaxID=2794353 RepID=A0A940P7V2_9ENTE|nr:nitroreductase family protein [Vagococcus allomyrinae]MBP1039685.1 nitroreductase family protein [Vagococcus allomyrinae]
MTKTINEAIVQRRTSKRSLADNVSLDLIYDLLEKARYAPFHKREPWQAKIITTPAEKEFLYANVMARYEETGLIHDAESRTKFETKMTRLLKNAPATVLFAREIITDNKRLNSDAIQGTAALIQNFSLLAHEAGLVGFWASSAFTMDQEFSTSLGFPDNFELIANYRLGYPDPEAPRSNGRRAEVKSWATPLL